MLRQADKIGQPIREKDRDAEYQRQHPQAGDDADNQYRAVECQQRPRPPYRTLMLLWLIAMKGAKPLVDRRPLIGRHLPHSAQNGDDQGRDQPAFAEGPATLRQQVDGEQLQHEARGQRRFQRQQVFPVSLRVQRITMVVGMAAGVIERVPPTDHAEQIEEEFVQPFGLEDRAVSQLVRRRAGEKARDRAVQE